MSEEASVLPELIQNRQAFSVLVGDLGRQRHVAVDTESNSLHAYRERVCLIQFSTPDRDYVLDPLAVEDLAPLGPIFEDPRIEKVFHAAEYDILCLRRDYGFGFANIFDTMQAGRILGRKMAGLDRLLEEKFGLSVDKRLQKADWGARPLTETLLHYAARDTHYLIPLRDMLEQELLQQGLLELAQEDFRMECSNHNHSRLDNAESAAWVRLSARRDLSPQDRTILKELVEWREAVAEQLDRPPFKVIGDGTLIEVARAKPLLHDELGNAGLNSRQARQWGADLLQAVARALQKPLVNRSRPQMPSAAYLKRLEHLKEWRKKVAAGMDVESDVVLPRGLLLELADRGAADVHAIMKASPWRLQRFGDQISEVLARTPS